MASTQLKAVIILCALLLGACLTLAQERQVAQAPPAITFQEWKEVDRTDLQVEYSVTFPSAFTSSFEANNVVPLRILLPAKVQGPIPAVILLHYWGARDLKVERALGSELNRHGYAAVLVTLPYHLARTPPGADSGDLALQPDPASLTAMMVQSIWDVRRTIDWIQTRQEFDHARVGIEGTSLGAVVSTLAYAIDPRITDAAFVLGGVDIAHIIWTSSRTVRQRDALRHRGFTEGRLREALKGIEPLTYMKPERPGNTFVIGANYDTVVPRGSTDELIRALGQPKTLFVDTGHYGGIFVERRLLREIGNFFNAVFAGKEFVPPSKIYAPTIRIGGVASIPNGFDLAAGLDLFRLDKRGDGYSTLLLTPRGPQLFLGRRIDSRISVGFIGSLKKLGFGFFWSTVL
jgi:dienelactone hydrolase